MSRGAIGGDVTPRDTIEPMPPVRRILKLLGAAFAFAVYVWFAAVRYVPGVKARKARRRSR
jgi:hypothetical protein